MKTTLITGAAGFIGSNFSNYMIKKYPFEKFIITDALTYAGNLNNLNPIKNHTNFSFLKLDIREAQKINELFQNYKIDHVIHFAAESHVDNSIVNPNIFAETNILGTLNLLNAARSFWDSNFDNKLFYHISTDEVYGSLGDNGFFTEETPYQPNSPYSASKAASDHFVRAFNETYNLPTIISNCSNNYGPYQFPEKLIPVCIQKILNNEPIPIYGDGTNVRDWLYVQDHVEAIELIIQKGKIGSTYNIGGNNELSNLTLVEKLIKIIDKKTNRKPGASKGLIQFVKDRAGHDFRYAIDSTKIKSAVGWQPKTNIDRGIEMTIDWYLSNQTWLNEIKTGTYRSLDTL